MKIYKKAYEVSLDMLLCSTVQYSAVILSAILLLVCSTEPSYSQVTIESINKSFDRDLQRQLNKPSQPSPPRDEGASKNLLQEAINESNKAARLMRQGYNYQINAQRSLYSARDKDNQAQKNLARSEEIAKKTIDLAQEKANQILNEANLQRSGRNLDKKLGELEKKEEELDQILKGAKSEKKKMAELDTKEKKLDQMLDKADKLLNKLGMIAEKFQELQKK